MVTGYHKSFPRTTAYRMSSLPGRICWEMDQRLKALLLGPIRAHVVLLKLELLMMNRTFMRSLNLKNVFSTDEDSNLERTKSLSVFCSDVFFYESNLRSDHFGSLHNLRSLNISYCKLRTLPPRSFVGLTNLEQLSVQTFNSQWSAITLDLDYEAFIGLEKFTRLNLT